MDDNNSEAFDKLLHNYDFDNQQLVISIEKENQVISDLTKDIEITKLSIIELQESVSELDETTKRVHKQYTINRDTCISLKKTSAFLTQHLTTLSKKLDAFISKNRQEECENQKILDHYWNVWKDYDAKYQQLPFVKMLESKVKEFSLAEIHLNDKKQEKQKLVTNVTHLQDSKQLHNDELQKFIVDLSQLKLNSMKQQKNISLLDTKIKQRKKQKQEANMTFKVDSSFENVELNKENIQPNVCLEMEEAPMSEKMDDQCLNKGDRNYEPVENVPSFEPKTKVSLQLGNSAATYGENLLISKSTHNTKQLLDHDSLFKQPDGIYTKNQKNNAKVLQVPSVSNTNPIISDETILPSKKANICEATDKFSSAPVTTMERTNISVPTLHSPFIPKLMLNKISPQKCNQGNKFNFDHQFSKVPATPLLGSGVNIVQPEIDTPKKVQAPIPLSPFPIAMPQPSVQPVSTSSAIASPANQPIKSASHISSMNNEGTPDDENRPFNFNEHQSFMKKFNCSPGGPILKHRPMFQMTDSDIDTEEVEEKKKPENSFFLQSFFHEQEETSQVKVKETPFSVKSPTKNTPSPYTDPFPGFNQNLENETAAYPLDFGFSNSVGEPTTPETNFFSFESHSGFGQTEDASSSFTFNFNSTQNSDTEKPFSLF